MPGSSNLPPGIQLNPDETVIRSGKDWGSSIHPLLLTSQRLICPIDQSGGGTAVIDLTRIHEVRFRKSPIGFASIIIEYGDQQRAAFPAYLNGQRIRAEIVAAIDEARRLLPSRPESAKTGGADGDRYERLRRIGQLRSSGVLTEAEFQEEKARILGER
ncbi:MAG TPA: SHOCT domain-containing protein [Candidatus Dormibacteraeota bacterium]|jgi:hypothetical protein|nr:SHOCT domain-containing protein [Candidatus Dormibacteraeota bacterium]